MAAVGGGWFSDYVNFPLWNLDHEASLEKVEVVSGKKYPLQEKLVVYDIISPTLASGVGIEWLDKLEALLEDTIQKCPRNSEGFDCFYTDSLAIHSIRADGDATMAPKTENKVATPFEGKDPVFFDDPELCATKSFRTKLTVHFNFSPQALQRARHVPLKERHPRYRSKLAGYWLERWQELCHKKNDKTSTETTE